MKKWRETNTERQRQIQRITVYCKQKALELTDWKIYIVINNLLEIQCELEFKLLRPFCEFYLQEQYQIITDKTRKISPYAQAGRGEK